MARSRCSAESPLSADAAQTTAMSAQGSPKTQSQRDAAANELLAIRDAILSDGRLTVCTQCAARRDLTEDDLLPGVRIAGAATFVDEILKDGAQALVY